MSAFLLGAGFRADMGTCVRKLVLLKLIDACEDDGSRIFPAMATVARAAQCSTRQVQREIRAFLDIGLLSLVREGGKGRRSTNEYQLDLDVLHAIGREGWDAYVAAQTGEGAASKGDTVSPLADAAKGDTGDGDRVTPETPKGDTRSRTTPPDSSLDPSRERGARESEREDGQSEELEPSDTPGRADFEKRVMRFCTGKGFLAGQWPNWDTSSPGWIGRQFAALTPAERVEAERWRDAYLFDIAERKQTPVVVGNFLNGRLWTGLDPAILERVERRRHAQLKPEERAQPDGWAACLGPVGMAWLFARLIEGPADAAMASRPFLSDPQLREAWPSIWWFQAMQRQKGGAVFEPRWHALSGAMEFVPRDTAVFAAWREAFAEKGWRWLNAFDAGRGAYFPRGGPGAIDKFEHAVADGEGRENEDEHGGRAEAAE